MINIDVLITQLSGLQRQDLERWILNEWVRPDRGAGTFVFREIDVARVKLIQELRDDMEINEAAMPVVLSLLDQLYDLRRRMRVLGAAIGETAPEDVQQNLTNRLVNRTPSRLPDQSK